MASSLSRSCLAQPYWRLVSPMRVRDRRRHVAMRTLLLITLMSMCTGLSLAAQRGRGAGPSGPPNPFQGQPEAIEQGRALYNERCTVCHGFDGSAGEMGPALGLEGRRFAPAGYLTLCCSIRIAGSGPPNPGVLCHQAHSSHPISTSWPRFTTCSFPSTTRT